MLSPEFLATLPAAAPPAPPVDPGEALAADAGLEPAAARAPSSQGTRATRWGPGRSRMPPAYPAQLAGPGAPAPPGAASTARPGHHQGERP